MEDAVPMAGMSFGVLRKRKVLYEDCKLLKSEFIEDEDFFHFII